MRTLYSESLLMRLPWIKGPKWGNCVWFADGHFNKRATGKALRVGTVAWYTLPGKVSILTGAGKGKQVLKTEMGLFASKIREKILGNPWAKIQKSFFFLSPPSSALVINNLLKKNYGLDPASTGIGGSFPIDFQGGGLSDKCFQAEAMWSTSLLF